MITLEDVQSTPREPKAPVFETAVTSSGVVMPPAIGA